MDVTNVKVGSPNGFQMTTTNGFSSTGRGTGSKLQSLLRDIADDDTGVNPKKLKNENAQEFVEPKKNKTGGIIIDGYYVGCYPKPVSDKKMYNRTIRFYIRSLSQPQNQKYISTDSNGKKWIKVPLKKSKADIDNKKATQYEQIEADKGGVWNISIPIDDFDTLELGDFVEIHKFEISYWEKKDSSERFMQGNGNPFVDKTQSKAMMYNFFMANNMITNLVEKFPFENPVKMKEMVDSRYSNIIFLRRDENFATQVDIADPEIHSHLSLIEETSIRDLETSPKSWAFGEEGAEGERLGITYTIVQGPIGPTRETVLDRHLECERLLLFSQGFSDALSIFGLHDVNKWKKFGPIFFAEQTSFPYFAAIEVSAKDSDDAKKKNPKSNCRSGKILFFYADVGNFYKRIGIPISEKNVVFSENSKLEPILNKTDVVRVDSESNYRTDSLRDMKNVSYRAIVNFTPDTLEKYRDEIFNMSVDTGDKLYNLFKNWKNRNNIVQKLGAEDPAVVFYERIRGSVPADPVVIPFALIDRSFVDPSAQSSFDAISRQMGMNAPRQLALTATATAKTTATPSGYEDMGKTTSPQTSSPQSNSSDE